MKAVGKGKGSGTWRQAFDAANPWYQILVTCLDWSICLNIIWEICCNVDICPLILARMIPLPFQQLHMGKFLLKHLFDDLIDFSMTGKLLEGGSVVSIVGDLKQRRFWANMHLNHKWGLFLLLCLDATTCLTKCLHSNRDDIFEWRTLTRSGLCAILHGQCFCPNFNASRIHCPFPSSIPVIRPFPH